ncbi:MAG: nucleotidyltransferase family protein [Pseudomonadota bacterium]
MSALPSAAMVFAAGFGTRMGPLTKDRPKPLIPVAGKPLLDHALDQVRGAGISRAAVNAHYKADQIAAHLQGTDIALSLEAPEILDTGGGLVQALGLLSPEPGAPVFAINSDSVWQGPNPLSALRNAWQPSLMDALLLVVPPSQAVGRTTPGDFHLDADGRLHRKGDFVYTGAQILKTSAIANPPGRVFSLNWAWDQIADTGRLYGLVWPGQWCDVGHPGGLNLAEGMMTGHTR